MFFSKKNILNIINKNKDYYYGFSTDVKSESIFIGINKSVVEQISKIKNEPTWLLNFRLKAFRYFNKLMEEKKIPKWGHIKYPNINFDSICYFSAPKNISNDTETLNPKILDTYNKLGVPLTKENRFSNVAVDAIFDSVSVATTYSEELLKLGIIFCSFSKAVKEYPDLIKKYLGSVIPYNDNFYAALNSAVFSDGSFCYIPKNIKCPMDLSTYFRINTPNIGQFERTLIIAEDSSEVSYLEGCTASIRDENQLHAAVVELITFNNAKIKYSTVQNWYPGNSEGKGGILNFVTKRGICLGSYSKISWTQVEIGASITWKYPSVILKGNNSVGEFYSIAITKNYQQADTGSKMIHLGNNTSSVIISKGISTDFSQNSYRGLVQVNRNAKDIKNYSQCDSLIFGNNSGAHTFPTIISKNKGAQIAHEATTSKISEEKLFYCQQRGLNPEDAINIIVNGFCKNILTNLPMEFAVEARKLLEVTLENTII